ncbi:FxLYD domain-containing protein [Microbacterium excoecariae]|uniref:FxLYD domain-containing protein n=1 Tax=Microbacterium excoecariae TaxID=2715210 RepID=UPI00140737B9|nr:FxLYD domain-containing protein [Microbacterium excoecariae]NHI16727.1 DUF4190 domain-containing protein [Microbacterium excoecariae]
MSDITPPNGAGPARNEPPAQPGPGAPTPPAAPQPPVYAPPPGAGAPAAGPGAGSPYGYPAAGSPVPPAGGSPYAPAPPSGGKGRAITALVLAIVGGVMCLIPFAVFLGIPLVIVAVILGIVTVAKKSAGRGQGIAAIIVGGVAFLVGLVMAALTAFILVGFAFYEDAGYTSDPYGGSIVDEYVDDLEGEEQAALENLTVAEQALWTAQYDDSAQVVVLIDNPDDVVLPGVDVTIEAVGEDGTILDTTWDYVTLTPGTSIAAGYFAAATEDESADLNVVFDGYGLSSIPSDEFGGFEVGELEAETEDGWTVVSGAVSNLDDVDAESVEVELLIRDADGEIAGLDWTYVERIPAEGSARFSIDLYDSVPEGASYEAFVQAPGF